MLRKLSTVLMVFVGLCQTSVFAQEKTLEERIAELEANQSLNIFSFSGTFITRFDDLISVRQTTPASPFSPALDEKDLTYLRMKFQLNVDANVSPYIKFYSRFTTSKNFNTFYRHDVGGASDVGADLGEANRYESSAVYLEKAYAEFFIPETYLSLSVGRLPTVDGPPHHFKDGRARMGTYPQMSFNYIFDGFGLTYQLDHYLPEKQKLALRFLYTPMSQYSVGFSGYLSAPADEATGAKKTTQVSVGAVQVDYSREDLNWLETLGVVVHTFKSGDIHYPGAANATAGTPGSSLDFSSAGTTLSLEFLGIKQTGWDVSLNYLFSTLTSQGQYQGLGLGTSGTEDTLYGGVFLLSTRYQFPDWVLGFEYVQGTKDSAYFATNDETLTDFYATKGDAYHVYVTRKFTQNLSLRLGCMEQIYQWTPTSLGPAVDTDRKIKTGYANLRLDF